MSGPRDRGMDALVLGSGLRCNRFELDGADFIAVSVPLPPFLEPLTPAEFQVARQLAAGRTNAQIAESRGASKRTVANQVASILRKLQVESRTEAAVRLHLAPLGLGARRA